MGANPLPKKREKCRYPEWVTHFVNADDGGGKEGSEDDGGFPCDGEAYTPAEHPVRQKPTRQHSKERAQKRNRGKLETRSIPN
jgi:hypothetical protein